MKKLHFSVNSLIIIIIGFLINSPLHAEYAKVVMIKGKVSFLGPGMHEPLWLENGMTLKEDTSIVTREKSVIKIRILADGSNILLGPDSKIVLTTIKKEKGSIISLLNGQMRAKVEKSKSLGPNESKVYIKTRTAALGVRGTEFVTVVNQQNHVTSLVTLEGTVAMNKIDTSAPEVNVEKMVKEAVDLAPQVTLVKKGNASTAYVNKEDITPPTKVNPVQLIALKNNEELKSVKDASDESAIKPVDKVELTKEEIKDLYAPDENGEVKDIPSNGAIVDLNSAIFIPEADKNLNIGKIDANTGAFLPAEGLKVDEKQGIIATDKDNKNAQDIAKTLNKKIDYKHVPLNYAPNHDLGNNANGASGELIMSEEKKYVVDFLLEAGNFLFERKNDDKEANLFYLSPKVSLSKIHPLKNRLALKYGLIANFIQINKAEYDTENSNITEDLIGYGAFIEQRYKISSDFLSIIKLSYQSLYIPLMSVNAETFDIGITTRTINTPSLEIALQTSYSEQSKLRAGIEFLMQEKNKSIDLKDGKRYNLEFTRQYSFSLKHHLVFALQRGEYKLNSVSLKNNTLTLGHQIQF